MKRMFSDTNAQKSDIMFISLLSSFPRSFLNLAKGAQTILWTSRYLASILIGIAIIGGFIGSLFSSNVFYIYMAKDREIKNKNKYNYECWLIIVV